MENTEEKKTNIRPVLVVSIDSVVRRSKSGEKFFKDATDIELVPGVEAALWKYRDMGFLLFGICNEGAIAHGVKSFIQVSGEMNKTMSLFYRPPFNIINFCPFEEHGNIEPYNRKSLLKMPNTGLLSMSETTCYDRGIWVDWANSIFVGNNEIDEKTAENAGISYMKAEQFLKAEEHEQVINS